MLKPSIFREYDIRGIAETELLSSGIQLLGQAIGTWMQRRYGRKVNVGRDVRLSGERLRDAIVAGLIASGCEVTDVGQVPTPLLYFSVQHLGADGGVMITGSHNPAEYNGFKIVAGGGTIYGEQITELRDMLANADLQTGEGSLRTFDIDTPYVEEISSQFQSLPRKVKVVLDAGNGAGGPAMHRILERLNVEATELFFEMDGNFPNHHPDPTVEENLLQLKQKVAETGAELGIAFDGDADRIGAVDENGKVVWGDFLLLIYAREILLRKPGATFIGEVKCSQVMYDQLNQLGARAIMYKTGHSLIKARMKQEEAELAGEMSGHMFFKDRYYGFDDALYAACRLIEIIAASGKPLSAQTEGLPELVSTPEIRVDTLDEIKFEVVRKVAEHFRTTRSIVDIDGARVLFPQGWGLVRASNTQPVLVMRFEAPTQQILDEYRREVEEAVENAKAAIRQSRDLLASDLLAEQDVK
ncbi:MAG: phosphomannomutase/phosphoglucomutase [Bryobacteraceae bacterium]|nr:phosphomannomutase/phosphoglucomutase [Bryobacteraceae bacterium]